MIFEHSGTLCPPSLRAPAPDRQLGLKRAVAKAVGLWLSTPHAGRTVACSKNLVRTLARALTGYAGPIHEAQKAGAGTASSPAARPWSLARLGASRSRLGTSTIVRWPSTALTVAINAINRLTIKTCALMYH